MANPDHGATAGSVLAQLESVIARRRGLDPEESYVASLLDGDEDRLLKKIGEEATEVMLAAKSGNREEIAEESADLLFHLMVVLARYDLGLAEVRAVLESRSGRSGLAEKNSRTQPDSS